MFITPSQKEAAIKALRTVLPDLGSDQAYEHGCHRMFVLPHHGESAEEFHKARIRCHPAMVHADNVTPLEIITRGPYDVGQKHSYTMGTSIPLKPNAPPDFEGLEVPVTSKKGNNTNNNKKGRKRATTVKTETPEARATPTAEIPSFFDGGWRPLGRTVDTKDGNVEDIRYNIKQLWFEPNVSDSRKLLMWPLPQSLFDLINCQNWGVSVSDPRQKPAVAYLRVINAAIHAAWMQCWATMMGRFMYCDASGARQTWPILIHLREMKCTLLSTSALWHVEGSLPARYSQDVMTHFTVYAKLNATRGNTGKYLDHTPVDVALHMEEWCSFLATHSLADAMFAWCIMNSNTEMTLASCSAMVTKRHQHFCSRGYMSHNLIYPHKQRNNNNNNDTDLMDECGETKTPSKRKAQEATGMYRVIQNTQFPKCSFPSGRTDAAVHLLSHPTIVPGSPLFSSIIEPLYKLRTVEHATLREMYGHSVFVSALQSVWALSTCMTVEERDKQLFRYVFKATNDGIFAKILELCSLVPPSASVPINANANNNARTQLRIAGFSAIHGGPRNEGRVVHLDTEAPEASSSGKPDDEAKGVGFQWLVHVGDGRPLTYNARTAYMGIFDAILDCRLNMDNEVDLADFKWERNHQSFYAPDASVDLARFYLFAIHLFGDEAHIQRRKAVMHAAGLTDSQRLVQDLGRMYFQIVYGSGRTVLSEYEIWLVLMDVFFQGLVSVGVLHAPIAITQQLVSVFWSVFVRDYHRYVTDFAKACVTWLQYALASVDERDNRRNAFRDWLMIEKYVTERRMSDWHVNSEESKWLNEALGKLCATHFHKWCGQTFGVDHSFGYRQLRWMLFFFLTHIIQPTPLPSAYFSTPTPLDHLQKLRNAYSLTRVRAVGPSDALTQLQEVVCHALSVGNVVWTQKVHAAWSRYAIMNIKATPAPHHSLDTFNAFQLVRELVTSIIRPDDCGDSGFVYLLQAYVKSHTRAMYIRVELPKPMRPLLLNDDADDYMMDLGYNEVDAILDCVSRSLGSPQSKHTDDDSLRNALDDILDPTVTVYVMAQTELERYTCEFIYTTLFATQTIEVVHVVDPIDPKFGPPDTVKEGHMWVKAIVDWESSPRQFRAVSTQPVTPVFGAQLGFRRF